MRWPASESDRHVEARPATRTRLATRSQLQRQLDPDRAGAGLVQDRAGYQAVSQRAERAWRAAGLEPIGLHDCRHTFASLMIAAGVNAKTLAAFMGHASITMTLDRYGHLFPGSEDEAAGLLDAYLERASKGLG
jgi:integrase